MFILKYINVNVSKNMWHEGSSVLTFTLLSGKVRKAFLYSGKSNFVNIYNIKEHFTILPFHLATLVMP